ncbi:MAG: histidine kinase [Myxococcota bacterium]
MDIRLLVIDIAEKLGLVATAALVSVLLPPLRNRVLGIGGQPQDRFLALLLGFCLAMWGAKMGQEWLGVHVHFMAIGILMAAIFQVGAAAGFLGGLFYVGRVAPTLSMETTPVAIVLAATVTGALGTWVVRRYPLAMQGFRSFGTASALQLVAIAIVAVGDTLTHGAPSADGLPAILVQVVSNSAGILLFVGVTRVVLTREENAVALVEARAAADQFALEALRRRLEPHFLFNALNTLRATIRVDPDRARTLVSDLSDLYRYLLHHPDDAPLEDEVGHAQAYLAIERARLGPSRLTVEVDLDARLRRVPVPALLLQPLVENAIKHGIAAHDGEGTVRMIASAEGDMLIVEVEDESQGDHVGVVEDGNGIALETLRARLSKRYGSVASLELHRLERGMRARIRLPLAENQAA